MRKKTIPEQEALFDAIAEIMKISFPYYEAEDLDDYVYLVRGEHINLSSRRIIEYLKRIKVM